MLGHRGVTHSLVFAALVGAVATQLLRRADPELSLRRLWMYFFLATASRGVFDAMTSGGLGVASFAPFDNTRYFFPWRPIPVSPLSIRRFFSERGLTIIGGEILWVWLPSLVFAWTAIVLRTRPRNAVAPPAV